MCGAYNLMKTPSLVEFYAALLQYRCQWVGQPKRRTILHGVINKVLDHEAGDHKIMA